MGNSIAATAITPILNRPEAAKYLRRSQSWLAKRAVYGDGPRYAKIGGSVIYRLEDLNEFICLNLRVATNVKSTATDWHNPSTATGAP